MDTRTEPRGGRTVRDAGFSLVELLVVILILGILAAIAIPVVTRQREKAYDASLRSDLRSVATAMEASRTAEGVLPLTKAELPSGLRTSPGNVVDVAVAGEDFCLSASHGTSSRTWVFDTATGGMADAAGASCAGSVAFALP